MTALPPLFLQLANVDREVPGTIFPCLGDQEGNQWCSNCSMKDTPWLSCDFESLVTELAADQERLLGFHMLVGTLGWGLHILFSLEQDLGGLNRSQPSPTQPQLCSNHIKTFTTISNHSKISPATPHTNRTMGAMGCFCFEPALFDLT